MMFIWSLAGNDRGAMDPTALQCLRLYYRLGRRTGYDILVLLSRCTAERFGVSMIQSLRFRRPQDCSVCHVGNAGKRCASPGPGPGFG